MFPRTHWKEFGSDVPKSRTRTRYKLQSLYGCTHSVLVLVSSNYLHFFATALLIIGLVSLYICYSTLSPWRNVKKSLWWMQFVRGPPPQMNQMSALANLGLASSSQFTVWLIGLTGLIQNRLIASLPRINKGILQHFSQRPELLAAQRRSTPVSSETQPEMVLAMEAFCCNCYHVFKKHYCIKTLMCRSRQRQQRQL